MPLGVLRKAFEFAAGQGQCRGHFGEDRAVPRDDGGGVEPLDQVQGLAPIIRQEIWACLAALKAEGESILVIDKNVDALAKIADRHVVLEKGRVVWRGSSDDLRSDSAVKDRFLHF